MDLGNLSALGFGWVLGVCNSRLERSVCIWVVVMKLMLHEDNEVLVMMVGGNAETNQVLL